MPGMDGWAVLGALKSDPELRDIPIVMLTMVDHRNLGFALGAADYLTKPIDRDHLVRALRREAGPAAPRPALIVEDDAGVRQSLRALLEAEGFSVTEAEDGSAALERVRAAPPQLILLDLMMPGMDGFAFAAELRRHREWQLDPGAGADRPRPLPGRPPAAQRLRREGDAQGPAPRRGHGGGPPAGQPPPLTAAAQGGPSGRWTEKVVPASGELSTATRPPCAPATPRTRVSPRPQPLCPPCWAEVVRR